MTKQPIKLEGRRGARRRCIWNGEQGDTGERRRSSAEQQGVRDEDRAEDGTQTGFTAEDRTERNGLLREV